MNAINCDQVYMRSLATRQSNLALSAHVNQAIDILKVAEFDLIILETYVSVNLTQKLSIIQTYLYML